MRDILIAKAEVMSAPVEVSYDEMLYETGMAGLFVIEGEEVWISLSQIEDDTGSELTIPEWLALEKGLV